MDRSEYAGVEQDIAALQALDRPTLLRRWRSAFGRDAQPRLSQALMKKALAYEIQIKAYGGPSGRVVRALKAAAKPNAVAVSGRTMSPGTRLIREWNGVLHEVEVLEDGYLWQGSKHRSLSAVAREITGTRWSGPRFFSMRNK